MPVTITIIGAGPGGYVAAIRAAQLGARVTVVENTEVGGTCLNRGCIPTKSIIASAEALDHTRNAGDFGVEVTGTVGYNLEKIRERKSKIISAQVKGIRALFKSWEVNLIEGQSTLLTPDTVRVIRRDGAVTDIKSDRIILATGSRPALLPGFPFDHDRVITSDDAVHLKSIPESILIVGAGVIGCEFAFIYRTFGADVTMVEAATHAITAEDFEISELLERELKKAKIKLVTDVKVERVEKAETGMMSVRLSNGREVRTGMVLVAIGRTLNTENIGLHEIGIKTGIRGEIVVNDRMETSVPGIYAVGDVTGKIMLAHVASHQGLAAAANALGGSESVDYSIVPSCIFTVPEIGSVGLREQDLREKGIPYRVGRFPFRSLGKAHAMGSIAGVVKIIADEKTDKVLGVHICGVHATDLIHEAAMALQKGATAGELGHMIHAHPTLAEAIMEAAEDVHSRAIHVPKKSDRNP